MKISVENSFITDDSNECEQGAYFVQTTANAKFAEDAVKNGAKIITLEECKKRLDNHDVQNQALIRLTVQMDELTKKIEKIDERIKKI